MRREFILPPTDLEFLEHMGNDWETVTENGVMRVVIYGYQIPPGYNINSVNLYVRIASRYPDTQIDMAYFYPHLSRKDGKLITALAAELFDGKNWQRWSRHRTIANPWRPGIDNLETHFLFIDEWLKREVLK